MNWSIEENIKNAEIMVVDDSTENLQLLVHILREKGYRVAPANTGELAFASLKIKKPDLILLDVRFPGISGLELCKKIKSEPDMQKIPIVFITALEEVRDRVLGFEVGGSDFITKPIQVAEVLARVHNQLGIYFFRSKLEEMNHDLINEIEQRRKTEYALYNERELLKITLMSIGDGVICTDNSGNVIMINEIAKNLTGWHAENAIGISFEEVFNIIHEYSRKKCENPVQKVIDSGRVVSLANHAILISKDGRERFIADSAAPIIGNEGKGVGVVMIFRDVTGEKIRQKEMEFLSFHDQLTMFYVRSAK